MKKYLIRETGWAYNDSTYDRDGMQQIVYTFSDRNEAMDYLRFLNREYLCDNFYRIYSLEAGTPGMSWGEYRDGLTDMLVEMGLNPTIRLPLQVDMTLSMFPEKPTDEQLDRIVDTFDLTFFKLVEVPAEQTEFYYALLYENHDGSYQGHFYNYHGDQRLFFASADEALDHYRTSQISYEWYRDKWMNLSADENGNWSAMPAVLETLVEQSPFLRWEEGTLQLSYNSDTETLMQLNALLAKPLLVLEPVLLSQEHYASVDIDHTMAHNEISWKSIERRRLNYATVAALTESNDYREQFRAVLPSYGSWTLYPDIIHKHVCRLLQIRVGQRVQLPYMICVARSVDEVFGMHQLVMDFGFNYTFYFSETQPGSGSGATYEEAIVACLEDWFVKNEAIVLQKLPELDLLK